MAYEDRINSTLVNYLRDKWVDGVFNSLPTTTILLNTGRVRQREMGGDSIVETVIVAKNTSFDCLGFYGTVNLMPEEYTKQAKFQWKQFGGGLLLSLPEISMSSNSKFATANLIAQKMRVSEMSAAEKFNTILHGLNNAIPERFLGLQDLVSTTVSIGGIDPAVTTQWKAYVESTAGILSLDDMMTGYLSTAQPAGYNAKGEPSGNAVSGIVVQPDFIMTTSSLWRRYHQQLTPTIRHESSAKIGKMGWQSLMFENAMVLWDNETPSGTLYYLNTEYLFLTFGLNEKKKAFTLEPLTKIPGKSAKASEFYCMVIFHTDNRRYLGKLTGRTPN